jgi:hypothetical protein
LSDRYLIICKPIDGAPAWVVAETPDRDWAEDSAITWRDYITLARGEAQLDPDFAEALDAWDRRDDSTYVAAMAMEDAEMVIRDALPVGEFKSQGDSDDRKSDTDLDVLEAFHQAQGVYCTAAVRFTNEGKPQAGEQLARLIVRDAYTLLRSKWLV